MPYLFPSQDTKQNVSQFLKGYHLVRNKNKNIYFLVFFIILTVVDAISSITVKPNVLLKFVSSVFWSFLGHFILLHCLKTTIKAKKSTIEKCKIFYVTQNFLYHLLTKKILIKGNNVFLKPIIHTLFFFPTILTNCKIWYT